MRETERETPPREIRLEGETGRQWCVFPCQGGEGECRVPVRPNAITNRSGQSVSWALAGLAPITISPSIDCGDCGFHGFIEGGQIARVITPGDAARLQARIRAAFEQD